jgi:hypothetical protein
MELRPNRRSINPAAPLAPAIATMDKFWIRDSLRGALEVVVVVRTTDTNNKNIILK